ncbi:hypothetical protein H4Q26_013638 [Puccinia striiformis f. sp. tritici PST-130]|nr:hypothetical protein H4Q26_013638 [Puccinia striiformis f. sp. tritici PST-130]
MARLLDSNKWCQWNLQKHDYHAAHLGHHERLPYDNGTIRSIYHVREYDVFRLAQLPIASSSDIFISHDWPVGIEQYGNTAQLLRANHFSKMKLFRTRLVHLLLCICSKPLNLIIGSLHTYTSNFRLVLSWPASTDHHSVPSESVALNPDELKMDLNDDDEDEQQHLPVSLNPPVINPDMIAIDDSDDEDGQKASSTSIPPVINPDVIDIDDNSNDGKEPENNRANYTQNSEDAIVNSTATLSLIHIGFAITRAFHPFLPLKKHGNLKLPSDPTEIQNLINQQLEWVKHNIAPEALEVNNVQKFIKTAPGISDPGGDQTGQRIMISLSLGIPHPNFSDAAFWYTNPQTLALADLLKIENKVNPPFVE